MGWQTVLWQMTGFLWTVLFLREGLWCFGLMVLTPSRIRAHPTEGIFSGICAYRLEGECYCTVCFDVLLRRRACVGKFKYKD